MSLSETKIYLNVISCSFPSNIYNQNQMKQMFIENYCGGKANLHEKDLDFINRIFSAALIETSNVNLSVNDLFARMTRQQYTDYVKATILELSCRAAKSAIENSNEIQLNKITHLIFGTMTSTICAPSMDIFIAKELHLNNNVKRLNVESMGCLTGFRLLGLARDVASQADENVILLIVCDIRSALGNQLTPFDKNQSIDKSNVIVSALFRDGCAAAIISQNNLSNSIRIVDHNSFLIDDTIELGRLKEFNDSSIHLYLDIELPNAVFRNAPNMVFNLLDQYQININNCLFAVHTGGPKIIRGIKQCLNLKDEQLCAPWFVLINYGNLSGSSNLIVLHFIYKWKYSKIRPIYQNIVFPEDFDQYKYVVGLSFGPGVAMECVLLRLE